MNFADPTAWVDAIAAGDRAAIARALNLADDAHPSRQADRLELLGRLWQRQQPDLHLIGITGPPGVGKSTLTARLIEAYRRRGNGVGVLAIDPSSRLSGGALLGDRIRMQLPADDRIFVRSLATRDHHGGLATAAWPAKLVLGAAFDRVILESVGVGQTETEIADATDTVALVMQPASGDSVQFIKAGIMEVPDLFVLNKVDLPESSRTWRELRAALRAASRRDDDAPPLLRTEALQGRGIAELVEAIEARAADHETVRARRKHQWAEWLHGAVLEHWGRQGLARLGGRDALQNLLSRNPDPFHALAEAGQRLGQAQTTNKDPSHA